MQMLTGEEFVSIYSNKKFYKLTTRDESFKRSKFVDGLNDNSDEIYFTEYDKIAMWLSYNGNQMFWIREVDIPFDAKVYVQTDKFHASPNSEEIMISSTELDLILKEKSTEYNKLSPVSVCDCD